MEIMLVQCQPKVQKNNPGGQDYSDVRMYEVVSNSMDAVKAFEFYLSKLHPEIKNLFSKSKKIFSRDDIWFTKEVIGKNTLVSMMKNISNRASLRKFIQTNALEHRLLLICTKLVSTHIRFARSPSIKMNQLWHIIFRQHLTNRKETLHIFYQMSWHLSPVKLDTTTPTNTTPTSMDKLENKASHLIQSVMPNGTFNNCNFEINFQGFSKQLVRFFNCFKKG